MTPTARVTVSAPVPDELTDPFFAAGIVAALVGTHEQVPPAYSAIKRGWKGCATRPHARGRALVLEPRTHRDRVRLGCSAWSVTASTRGISSVGLEGDVYSGARPRPGSCTGNRGASWRAAAHALRWRIDVDHAHTLGEIEVRLAGHCCSVDPMTALGLAVVEVSEETAERVLARDSLDAAAHGGGDLASGAAVSVVHGGVLLGVYARSGDELKPHAIIPGGVRGAA